MTRCANMNDTAFLRFKPTVCAVEEDYVILLATSVRGMALLEIGGGSVPMIFSRGNHDTRGRLSERFTDYFPTANGKTYYTVKLGPLHVLVLDGGEDKPDKCAPYDNTADVPEKYRGLNRFHEYRREEAHFLKDLADRGEKFDFAVSHICPHMRNNIDADVYAEWMASLDRLGIQFMLCGRYHRCSLIDKENTATVFPRSYPIIVASGVMEDDYHGGAITYFSNRIEIAFTNTKREVVANHVIPFA